uniref:F-box domain-containing protein n=1 Tax=Psilocybe cubensis TaxID=181762 RepID=A0A8H7Y2R6_PSICU
MSLITSTIQRPHNSVNDIPQKDRYLLTLPTELTAEILKLVEWTDILHIRRTCKYLAEVTRSRNIWSHLVIEYMSTNSLLPCLERPVSMYSSQELENIFLRWKSADRAFESSTLEPARERRFTAVDARWTHLVKGGRWFLMISQTASMTYFDLDSEIITGIKLIPDQISNTTKISTSIEHDTQSPFLRLTVALSFPSWQLSDRYLIQVWRVAAVLDDKNYVVGLKATQIAWFGHDLAITRIISLSLLGTDLAFIGYSTSHRLHVYVVNWQEFSKNPTQNQVWSVPAMLSELGLRKKLLVATHNNYMIYDYASPSTYSSSSGFQQPSFQTVWETEDHELIGYFSSACFFDDTKASIVRHCQSSIRAITFTHSSVAVEDVVDTLNAPMDDFTLFSVVYFGYRRSFLISSHLVRVICYPPLNVSAGCDDGPERMNMAWCRKCDLKYVGGYMDIAADEDTGRIMYLTSKLYNSFAVVDFAKI